MSERVPTEGSSASSFCVRGVYYVVGTEPGWLGGSIGLVPGVSGAPASAGASPGSWLAAICRRAVTVRSFEAMPSIRALSEARSLFY